MDPIAHTFFGATLAETGLREKSRYATGTLIAGANLPDIDAIATFGGEDFSLWARRGNTHGIVAMVILPLILAGVVEVIARKRQVDIDRRWIIGLSYLSVWSHPTLDFMNTYGVRLLMPFDGSWFYGDTLFIIDPWFWLLSAAGVVLARSDSRKAIVGWVILATLASALVFLVPFVHVAVKIAWAIGVVGIVLLRQVGTPSKKVARVGLALLVGYIGALFAHSAWKEARSADLKGIVEYQTNPVPGRPFQSDDIEVFEDRYELQRHDGERIVVPRVEPDEVVRAALDAPSVRGFANWMRFPYWEVEEEVDGWTVTFRDLRYVAPGEEPRGIGFARVRLNEDLKPVE